MTDYIGSYEVIGELGRGGMGEVLLGKDPRLDRLVAMKRIRLDLHSKSQNRSQFRREAQISANLNHPAIVHVHDLIEGDTEDVLIMEYVEGPNLREYLKESPLTRERRLELAAQIAAGLADAHRNGIIHRDLKMENVLITPTGRAKITDFGIALQVKNPQDQAEQGKVSGTYRAMSPEQAMGMDLDYRSDLFSFGIMLYELFTSQSPFLADTSEETLRRIVNEEPQSVEILVPSLPRALATLIHHLLAKQPALRPLHTQETAMELGRLARNSDPETVGAETFNGTIDPTPSQTSGLQGKKRNTWIWAGLPLLLAVLIWMVNPLQKKEADSTFVAVLKATSNTPDAVPTDLLFALREAAIEAITGIQDLYPLDPSWVDEVKGRPSRVATAVAADEALVINIRKESSRFIMVLRRISARDERILWSESLELHADEYLLALSGVKAAMTRAYPHTQQPGEQPIIEATEFLAYLREKRSFEKRERPLEEHLRKVTELRAEIPEYAPIYLLESEVSRFLFRSTREDRYLAMSFQLAEKGRILAPGDQRPLETLINLSLDSSNLDRAQLELDTLEKLFPADIDVARFRARLLEEQGQSEQAIALLQRAVHARPSWYLQFTLANMAFRLGKTDLARDTLDQLLILEPDHPRYLRLLALLELFQGSPEKALTHYLLLSKRAPSLNVWGNLATAQMLLGHYSDAENSTRKALALAPKNSALYLNLADCLSLQGRREEARAAYIQVLTILDEDPADAQMETLSTRAQAQAHLAMKTQARSTINQLLEQAPGNMMALYYAALVHAIIDDRAAALAYARQTCELGNDPRWFKFPWFDKIRDHPFFRELTVSSKADP